MRDKLAPLVQKLGVIATTIVLAILLVLSVLLAREVLRQVRDLSTATSDNVQWNVTQSEVEHLQLQAAVSRALLGGPLEQVRRGFDIFYSRVTTFQESALFAHIRATSDGAATLARIQRRLTEMVPVIDGPDQALRDGLPELASLLVANGHDVRSMTLLGLFANVQGADGKRKGMANTLQLLGWVVVALFIALAITALMIGWLYQRSRSLTAVSRAAAARMQAMVTSSLDAILMADTKGRIMAFNGAAESIFGYTREEALGGKMIDLIDPDNLRGNHLDGLTRFLATGKAQFIEQGRVRLQGKRKSGEIFPVELSITLSHSGKDTVFVSYLRDISDHIAAETELIQARDDALAGERAKANLLTVMSHEMRTPLTGVLGSMELMEATEMTPEQHSYVHAMRVSGELLLHHVNEVLELSQLEAGASSEESCRFNLEQLMLGLVNSQQAAARARGNTLDLRCRLNGQSDVLGRPRQIQQALLNLIGNAIKFTKDGIVTVEVDRLGTDEQVQVQISDTGAGIAAADLDRIFEDFVTLDASYGRISEGTGLGLAITRRLVDALQGVIEAESELGEGSLFRILLPLPVAPARRETETKVQAEPKISKQILVVEDNDINRVLMTKTLQRLGHQVTTASGGAEAVAATAEGQFDLILMDISMPGVDGIEAYRRIRAQNLAEGVDIVALTAHVAADDHARILDTGFAEVATKPISRSELSDLISRRTRVSKPPVSTSENSDIYQFVDALGVEKAQGFLTTYCQDMVQFIAQLDEDPTVTTDHRQEAHRLAGSAAVLGLDALRSDLLVIEEAELGAVLSVSSLRQAWSHAHTVVAPFLTSSGEYER